MFLESARNVQESGNLFSDSSLSGRSANNLGSYKDHLPKTKALAKSLGANHSSLDPQPRPNLSPPTAAVFALPWLGLASAGL